jgi:CxxC motif-containing protein (DUF1111 family)
MKRLFMVLVLLSSLSLEAQRRRPSAPPAAPPTPPPAQNTQFGAALPNLPPAQVALFNEGRREFVNQRAIETGLGPVFNGRSCLECHGVPAGGGGSARTVTRIGAIVNGVFDPLPHLGGGLLQGSGIGIPEGSTHRFLGERVPQQQAAPSEQSTIVARRRATPLFGLGLVDATDDTTFIALAQLQAARNDGTAGRVALVDNILAGMKTVGKFGWKAQVPTLEQFSGDAYVNEMGITSPLFPNEICPSGNCDELRFNPQPGLNDSGAAIVAVANFMRFLGAPPRGQITADATAGEAVFTRAGCDSCHTPSLQTGANANPALNRVTYRPFSDFLLHDMGSLNDGIAQDGATAHEMRTAPLWGLRGTLRFLHDSRATSIEAAITAHDGQGRAARDRFNALDATDRARLIAFLRSL